MTDLRAEMHLRAAQDALGIRGQHPAPDIASAQALTGILGALLQTMQNDDTQRRSQARYDHQDNILGDIEDWVHDLQKRALSSDATVLVMDVAKELEAILRQPEDDD